MLAEEKQRLASLTQRKAELEKELAEDSVY